MLFLKKMLIAVAALVVLSVPAFSFAAPQDGVTKAGTTMKDGAMKEGRAMMEESKGKGASMERNGTMMKDVVKNGTMMKDDMVKDNGMVKKQ